ncbi:MAG: DUF1013 domain-containing protein [Alphaproteobacteria bacterium]
MAHPLMPKATAVWLVDNTTLTFDQIAELCGLHPLEVQGIADGEVATGIQGRDPVAAGELSAEEIRRCEADALQPVQMQDRDLPELQRRAKGARYTPVAMRQDKPAAILWLVRRYPDMSDAQICRLIGTTKPTVKTIREGTHRDSNQLQPKSPMDAGLCTYTDLNDAVSKIRRKTSGKDKSDTESRNKTPGETPAQPADEGRQSATAAAAAAIAGFVSNN